MVNNQKCIYLASGGEEGFAWELQLNVSKGMKAFPGHFLIEDEDGKIKSNTRSRDKSWVVNNIPSSLWWNLQRHHDWEDGGRLYLLTKKEHMIRTKKERGG